MANTLETATRVFREDEVLQNRLLRGEEVVELTGYSRGKVYAMAASGEIPCLRHGRSVRFPLAGLLKWIESNTRGGDDAR